MVINKQLKKILCVIGVGALISLSSVFVLQLFHFQYDWEKAFTFFDLHTRLSLLQASIVFLIFLWLYLITTSLSVTSLLFLVAVSFLGVATQQKMFFRGEPVYPSDVYFLKDFQFLLEMVGLPIMIAFFVIVALVIIGIYLAIKNKSKIERSKAIRIGRLVGVFLTTFALFYVYQFNQPGNKVRAVFNRYTSWIAYSQEKNYNENGVVSGLMYNFKSPAVDKPENYSKEKITALYEKYREQADVLNKERLNELSDYNLIYIMNETFSDPTRIEGMSISKDPIPIYRTIEAQHRSGMVLSQGYGGGTANIEFEALTGISLEPLSANITTPFIQLNDKMQDFPSIVDLMGRNGHTLTAIHPYNSSMYKRLENYQALGFDSFLFEDDLTYSERIDGNNFISDASAYQEVLDKISQTETLDFVHLVTMHNHQPHVNKYNEVEFNVEGAPYNKEVAHYAKGLQYSDRELDEFLQEVNHLEEKTIVVFWGDHLPGFYGEELYELNGHVRMHQTPLLFYTNFTQENLDIQTISPIYFMNHILDIANAPVTPFIALLEGLEVVLPAFEKGIYLEENSEEKYLRANLKKITQDALAEYDLIMYDITTGKNYSKELGFY
ncbi:LTA synthase family protein [Jeotgalibaca dankookensis]|uniref:LTA synthase family protein n=1 Tax=Jeotgalibaca dankookensis TaxID=708126 RepID=UPI000AE4BB9B|nr:alkaline phosphatase family protein [Jeotgalibaca dankookensis]